MEKTIKKSYETPFFKTVSLNEFSVLCVSSDEVLIERDENDDVLNW